METHKKFNHALKKPPESHFTQRPRRPGLYQVDEVPALQTKDQIDHRQKETFYQTLSHVMRFGKILK
jgi:hypothetical protein